MVGGDDDDDVVMYGCGHIDGYSLESDAFESMFLLHVRMTRWICVDGRVTGLKLSVRSCIHCYTNQLAQ